MVSIPIRAYASGERSNAVSFNMLHSKCKTRVKQQYTCPKDGEVVPRDAMVKGYEIAKGQYVTFSEGEIKALMEESSRAIEIEEFLPLDAVDPTYYESAYYLGPDKGGEKAYALLSEALKRTGRVALAKWAARGRSHLVLIRPLKSALVLHTLKFQTELREPITVDTVDVAEPELDLAVALINAGAVEDFHPESYTDEVRDRLLAAIKAKVESGEEITRSEEEEQAATVDLMEALKASLAKKTAKPKAKAAKAKKGGK
jgi:DNA end-binding protein Ku